MQHNWEKYFDTSNEYWEKVQKIYKENDHWPKVVVSGRNLHHKFMRSFSKLEGTEIDNDKDNLVSLSMPDHLRVHYYLWKCTKKGFRNRTSLPVRFMLKKAIKYISEETIEQIIKDWDLSTLHTNKGKNNPMYGKHHTDTSKCISNGFKGHKYSDESKEKMRQKKIGNVPYNKGKPMNNEQKQKISDSVKNSMTREVREKISKSKKGKKQSKELVEKRRKSLIGKHYYNNGIICIRAETCPDGFVPGMLKRKMSQLSID